MGRDDAAFDRLMEHELHIIGQWENPGLAEKAAQTGGSYQTVDSVTNTAGVADFVEHTEPDMFLTNFDDALAADVVGVVQQRLKDSHLRPILIPSPNKEASRIEWDKFFLRDLINKINPKYNPENFMCTTLAEATEAIAYFRSQGREVVIKPRALTGGKGVKVMGKHLRSFWDDSKTELPTAEEYSTTVLADSNQNGLEVQEKLEGPEFTLQIYTDGNVMVNPPTTCDYPYRKDGDMGSGTGGMGTFSMKPGEQPPFMSEEDYNEAMDLMADLLSVMKERGIDYKGILYPSFIKTKDGIKIVEVNARGGDPELINILDVMEDSVDYAEVLGLIAIGELRPDSIRFKDVASTLIYLVHPDYAVQAGTELGYGFNPKLAVDLGSKVRFAASIKVGKNRYRTVGTSRTVGLLATGETPWAARAVILKAIERSFDAPLPLAFRRDIGDEDYIKNMAA